MAIASAAAAAASAFVEVGDSPEVRLPPTYVLRKGHVEDALKGIPRH
jgi:hypothetical protein